MLPFKQTDQGPCCLQYKLPKVISRQPSCDWQEELNVKTDKLRTGFLLKNFLFKTAS